MACDRCKRKGIPIKCAYCPGEYCIRCMPLDVHVCEGVSLKKELQRKELENNLLLQILWKFIMKEDLWTEEFLIAQLLEEKLLLSV